MKYLATINVPGYLPMDDDPPTFDTAREAWTYLADERWEAEDSAFQPGEDAGFSATVNMLESLGDGTLSLDEVGVDGTGSVGGVTPGYTGDHDLGLIYTVSLVEPRIEHVMFIVTYDSSLIGPGLMEGTLSDLEGVTTIRTKDGA